MSYILSNCSHISIPWYTSILKSHFLFYPDFLVQNLRLCVAGCFRKQILQILCSNSMSALVQKKQHTHDICQTSSHIFDSECFLVAHMLPARLRAASVGSLAAMEVLTLQHGRVFPAAACHEYKVCYLAYRSSMNSLAQWALDRMVCRYHLRPKQHQLGHLLHCLPKNPRYLANFLSEDFIYKSKVLAEKCHALFMSKQVLQRYAISVGLRWHNM